MAVVLVKSMPEEVFLASELKDVTKVFYLSLPGPKGLPTPAELENFPTVYLFGTYYSPEYVKSLKNVVIVVPEQKVAEKYGDVKITEWKEIKLTPSGYTSPEIENGETERPSGEPIPGMTKIVLDRHKDPTAKGHSFIKGYYEATADEIDPVNLIASIIHNKHPLLNHSQTINNWIGVGEMFAKRDARFVENRVKSSSRQDFVFQGFECSALPCSELITETKVALAKLKPIGLLFVYSSEPHGYQIKLETLDTNIDLLEIVKPYNGGGSKSNAGFFAPMDLAHKLLPFLN